MFGWFFGDRNFKKGFINRSPRETLQPNKIISLLSVYGKLKGFSLNWLPAVHPWLGSSSFLFHSTLSCFAGVLTPVVASSPSATIKQLLLPCFFRLDKSYLWLKFIRLKRCPGEQCCLVRLLPVMLESSQTQHHPASLHPLLCHGPASGSRASASPGGCWLCPRAESQLCLVGRHHVTG